MLYSETVFNRLGKIHSANNHVQSYAPTITDTLPYEETKGEGGADKNYLDMSFTNLTDLCIRYYNDTMQKYKDAGKNYFRDQTRNRHAGKGTKTAQQVLDELGY